MAIVLEHTPLTADELKSAQHICACLPGYLGEMSQAGKVWLDSHESENDALLIGDWYTIYREPGKYSCGDGRPSEWVVYVTVEGAYDRDTGYTDVDIKMYTAWPTLTDALRSCFAHQAEVIFDQLIEAAGT